MIVLLKFTRNGSKCGYVITLTITFSFSTPVGLFLVGITQKIWEVVYRI